MNTIQLPNLNQEPNSTIPTIINEKSYTFNYLWINDHAILDIYLNDVALIKGKPLVTGSDLIARIKNDDLITGKLFLINKFGYPVQPTQENFHTDYYLVWEE